MINYKLKILTLTIIYHKQKYFLSNNPLVERLHFFILLHNLNFYINIRYKKYRQS